jgi:hypothetical protein
LIDDLIVAEKHGDAYPTASHGNVGQQDADSGGVADDQQKHTGNSYDSDCTFILLLLAPVRTLVLNCFILFHDVPCMTLQHHHINQYKDIASHINAIYDFTVYFLYDFMV